MRHSRCKFYHIVHLLCAVAQIRACGFGLPPHDQLHRRFLGEDHTYPVLPRPVSTANNAFVQNDLLGPIQAVSGNDKTLLENLNTFAARNNLTDLCYWAFQALPPPRGGPSLLHPHRGYWDVSDGHLDQDIEWVQAYGEVAVARLHSRIEQNGPVVGAMCSMGAVIAKRRCENGASIKKKCIPAITNGTIQWPMAVSMWKVGHPDLASAVTSWRASSSTGHLPNIEWNMHLQGSAKARSWNGSMPRPGEISPPSMPQGPHWPISQFSSWGSPKIAKVVQCADVPQKFRYHTQNYYCDHMPPKEESDSSGTTASVSSVDEAYAVWTNLKGVWPPTKPCEDDQASLDKVLTQLKMSQLVGQNCSVVFPQLKTYLPNFDCDNSDTTPTIRNMCCSQCGRKPIPDVRPVPPDEDPPITCAVCKHQYNRWRDGDGKKFEDLPADWKCPVCGAPKSAYVKTPSGAWIHQ